jgi:hypothetical protein
MIMTFNYENLFFFLKRERGKNNMLVYKQLNIVLQIVITNLHKKSFLLNKNE